VNTSTAPVVGLAADLRAISSGATVVTLSGGGTANVGATTLETPPTQNAGGGFNASLSPASVTNDTPLVSGGSINVAFTVGDECVHPANVSAAAPAAKRRSQIVPHSAR
jgi:hypothetical protein